MFGRVGGVLFAGKGGVCAAEKDTLSAEDDAYYDYFSSIQTCVALGIANIACVEETGMCRVFAGKTGSGRNVHPEWEILLRLARLFCKRSEIHKSIADILCITTVVLRKKVFKM